MGPDRPVSTPKMPSRKLTLENCFDGTLPALCVAAKTGGKLGDFLVIFAGEVPPDRRGHLLAFGGEYLFPKLTRFHALFGIGTEELQDRAHEDHRLLRDIVVESDIDLIFGKVRLPNTQCAQIVAAQRLGADCR